MIPGNNWTGHICVLPFVIRDSYTLSDWNSFWNQLKNKNCKPIISIIAKIKYSILLWACSFFCLKRLSWLSNSSPANAGNCILESSILEISWGKCSLEPPLPLHLHLQHKQYKSASWTSAFKRYRKPCTSLIIIMSYHLYYIDYFKTLFFLVGLQDERPLVFLPLHKSHMDYLLLTFVLVTRDIKVGNVGEISNKENHFIQ